MSDQRVVQFEYQQSLFQASGSPRWSEELSISVRILAEAITTGWLRENFAGRGGANDFLVLLAIVMHARPLRGEDLEYLAQLNLATPEDENRLYARVSDLALAGELGAHRKTIATSAQRLAEKGFIAIREIPEETAFRDSHGRFSGSKIYLLAGDIHNRFLVKDVVPDGGSSSATVTPDHDQKPDRGHLTATVKSPTVVNELPHRGHSLAINLNNDEEDEEGFPLAPAEIIFKHFARRKGKADYKATKRELQALKSLLGEGYSTGEILAGIDRAFTNKAGIRQFTFCVPIIRDAAPGKTGADPAIRDTASQEGAALPLQEAAPARRDSDSPSDLAPVPERILQTYRLAAGISPGNSAVQRLRWLAEECNSAASARGEDVWQWLDEALKESAGRADNLLAYTIAVMRKRARELPRKSKPTQTSLAVPNKSRRPGRNADPALATARAFQNLFQHTQTEENDGHP